MVASNYTGCELPFVKAVAPLFYFWKKRKRVQVLAQRGSGKYYWKGHKKKKVCRVLDYCRDHRGDINLIMTCDGEAILLGILTWQTHVAALIQSSEK